MVCPQYVRPRRWRGHHVRRDTSRCDPDASDRDLTRRVVMTGAAGRIGRAISGELPQSWHLILTDARAGDNVAALDVTDLDACRTAFAEADAVVHLAGNPSPLATWDELHPTNVVGTYNVVQAAMDAGVQRLVLASSAQAVSGYRLRQQVRAEDPPRPANLYGATKAWAEVLGAWAAASSSTTVVALRIGYFDDSPPAGSERTPRNLSAWLSARDCANLVTAAVEAEQLSFVVANGISNNRHLLLDLETTRAVLGYAPVDDAWSGDPV
jgi:nucleoside-diphosphate-sugar epimerase